MTRKGASKADLPAPRLRALLAGGDRRSIAQVERARRLVQADPSRTGEVAALCTDGDPLVQMRAFDLLEKLARDDATSVAPFQRVFLEAPEKVLSILLGNLLRNAFSYTDSGEVVVEIGEGRVSIRDTGVGMAAEKIEEMFRPFVRGEDNRRGGHGVGLTIVRRLSDRFGWPITIQSQPGVGTTVEIQFPGARSEPIAA